MSTGKIFINYRKDDSNWNSLALYNALRNYFPDGLLFKDFNTIEPGDDFEISIRNALKACDVLLVIIGKGWLSAKDSKGNKRLFDPKDFVRLEISTALVENKRVIPVLFDDVAMPAMEDLPEDLHPLCKRQYYAISKERFDYDIEVLSEFIQKVLGIQKGPMKKKEVHGTFIKDDMKQAPKMKEEVIRRESSSSKSGWPYVIAILLIVTWGIIYFLGYAGGMVHLLLLIAIIIIITRVVSKG